MPFRARGATDPMLFALAAVAFPPIEGFLFTLLYDTPDRPVLMLALSEEVLWSARCRFSINLCSSSALAVRRFSSWYSSTGLVAIPVMPPAMSTAVDMTAEAPPLIGSHLVVSMLRGLDW
jgi:hypothetical protein